MKKTISVLLAIIIAFTFMPTVYAEGTSSLGHPVKGNINFYFETNLEGPGQPAIASNSIYYSDDYFKNSSFEYNHDLAKLSLAASMTGTSTRYKPHNHSYIVKSFLTNIGCEEGYINTVRYDKFDTTEDVCAVAFGVKNIPETEDYLVPVIIRGSDYGGEWISNARIYDRNHKNNTAGFRKAAEYAVAQLEDYLSVLEDEYGITKSNIKLWIVGYSRGGSIANNMGQILNKKGEIPQNNIFDYTFASPATVRKTSPKANGNIFNICSEIDIVPQIPMKEWGYTRYGTTLYLPCLSKNESQYKELLPKMQENFRDIMEKAGAPEVTANPMQYQEKAIDIFRTFLSQAIGSPEQYYYYGWQEMVEKIMANIKMPNASDETIEEIIINALCPVRYIADDLTDFYKGYYTRTKRENAQALCKILDEIDICRINAATVRDIRIMNALYSLLADYNKCLQYEIMTHGRSKSTLGYQILIKEIVDIINDGIGSPLLMQHWQASYLSWMRSGTAEELFTTAPHSSGEACRTALH